MSAAHVTSVANVVNHQGELPIGPFIVRPKSKNLPWHPGQKLSTGG